MPKPASDPRSHSNLGSRKELRCTSRYPLPRTCRGRTKLLQNLADQSRLTTGKQPSYSDPQGRESHMFRIKDAAGTQGFSLAERILEAILLLALLANFGSVYLILQEHHRLGAWLARGAAVSPSD